MSAFGIASRILVALGATGSLLAASAAGCGNSGSNASAGAGSGGAGTSSSSTIGGTGGAASSSSGGTGGTGGGAGDAGSDAADATSDGPPCIRRPFLVDGIPRAGEVAERSDWLDVLDAHGGAPADAATAAALAEAWAHDGTQEHASIAAFARFVMLMVAVGAPPDLIVGAQKAVLDEVAHARGCFGLATRHGGRAFGPGPVSLRGALPEAASLADVAALTVHEGCVGETLGVLLATEQRDGATDPAARAVLSRIVRDEQRHAELAWRFVRWALAHGGAPVRAAVEQAFADAARVTLAVTGAEIPGVDRAAWKAHGRLTAEESRALVRKGLAEIVEPCRAALLDLAAPGAPATHAGSSPPAP